MPYRRAKQKKDKSKKSGKKSRSVSRASEASTESTGTSQASQAGSASSEVTAKLLGKPEASASHPVKTMKSRFDKIVEPFSRLKSHCDEVPHKVSHYVHGKVASTLNLVNFHGRGGPEKSLSRTALASKTDEIDLGVSVPSHSRRRAVSEQPEQPSDRETRARSVSERVGAKQEQAKEDEGVPQSVGEVGDVAKPADSGLSGVGSETAEGTERPISREEKLPPGSSLMKLFEKRMSAGESKEPVVVGTAGHEAETETKEVDKEAVQPDQSEKPTEAQAPSVRPKVRKEESQLRVRLPEVGDSPTSNKRSRSGCLAPRPSPVNSMVVDENWQEIVQQKVSEQLETSRPRDPSAEGNKPQAPKSDRGQLTDDEKQRMRESGKEIGYETLHWNFGDEESDIEERQSKNENQRAKGGRRMYRYAEQQARHAERRARFVKEQVRRAEERAEYAVLHPGDSDRFGPQSKSPKIRYTAGTTMVVRAEIHHTEETAMEFERPQCAPICRSSQPSTASQQAQPRLCDSNWSPASVCMPPPVNFSQRKHGDSGVKSKNAAKASSGISPSKYIVDNERPSTSGYDASVLNAVKAASAANARLLEDYANSTRRESFADVRTKDYEPIVLPDMESCHSLSDKDTESTDAKSFNLCGQRREGKSTYRIIAEFIEREYEKAQLKPAPSVICCIAYGVWHLLQNVYDAMKRSCVQRLDLVEPTVPAPLTPENYTWLLHQHRRSASLTSSVCITIDDMLEVLDGSQLVIKNEDLARVCLETAIYNNSEFVYDKTPMHVRLDDARPYRDQTDKWMNPELHYYYEQALYKYDE